MEVHHWCALPSSRSIAELPTDPVRALEQTLMSACGPAPRGMGREDHSRMLIMGEVARRALSRMLVDSRMSEAAERRAPRAECWKGVWVGL